MFHETFDTWKLYAHLPHDTDWTIHSYKYIAPIESVEELLSVQKHLPNELIQNCMLFLMRNNIMPIWEDEDNVNGGCLSYKIPVEEVPMTWNHLSCYLICENITNDISFLQNVNGITLSPKKHFGILKIWLRNCEKQNTDWINPEIDVLRHKEVIFKKHGCY